MTDTTGNLPFFAITAIIGTVIGAVIGGIVAAKMVKTFGSELVLVPQQED